MSTRQTPLCLLHLTIKVIPDPAAHLKPPRQPTQTLSLTKLLSVFVFNKQNQLLVLSVYSLPGPIALQSKQSGHSIVLSI